MSHRPSHLLLIRHGHTDAIGARLVGRLPGVSLSTVGRQQAAALPRSLRRVRIDAIYTSPLLRARKTAAPLAQSRGLRPRICAGLDEVDFGAWTGLAFDVLDTLAEWQRYNANRSAAEVPGGESARSVQCRIVRTIERLARRHAGETIALVTHAELVRAAVLHYTHIPLDDWHRVRVDPGSVALLAIADEARLIDVFHSCRAIHERRIP